MCPREPCSQRKPRLLRSVALQQPAQTGHHAHRVDKAQLTDHGSAAEVLQNFYQDCAKLEVQTRVTPLFPNMPRSSHRKSRKGCGNCKARKIKCDERQPGCWQCEKHAIHCDYQSSAAARTSEEARPVPSQTNLSHASEQHSSVGADVYRFSGSKHENRLDLDSLELFYHFVFEACDATFRNPSTNLTWKKEVSRLALKHEFLMHGILALSAMHITQVDPCRSELSEARALQHHSKALGLYWPTMDQINCSNGEALFAFALLLTPIGFCSPENREKPLEKAFNCLQMCRGFGLLHDQALSWVKSGSLAPIAEFQQPWNTSGLEPVSGEHQHWEFRGLKISNPNRELDSLVEAREHLWLLGEEETQTHRAVIESLRECFFHVSTLQVLENPPPQIPAWASCLPDLYMEHLKERHPLALAILAYYCTAFVAMEERWFGKGWAQTTISAIQRCLPNYWQRWIVWPVCTIEILRNR